MAKKKIEREGDFSVAVQKHVEHWFKLAQLHTEGHEPQKITVTDHQGRKLTGTIKNISHFACEGLDDAVTLTINVDLTECNN